MRILQISHNNHIVGGSDAVFMQTSALLRAAGHEVIPFCMQSPNNEPTPWADYFPRGADTRNARPRDGLRYFYNGEARRKLTRLLEEHGPVDLAHIHIYHGKQTPAILPVLRARAIPIIQSLHEYKLACPVYTMERNGQTCELCVTGSSLNGLRHRCKENSVLKSLVMVAEHKTARLLGDIRLIDRFLCVSAFQRQVMKRSGIASHKLATLHNFVDTDAIPFEAGHDGYLFYAGRIEELKGLPTLIDAVKGSRHRLLVAGTGSWVDTLKERISGAPNIEYLGFHTGSNLRRLMARAKALVIPSKWYENCPMSLLEAKAAGRPVVGADIGGIPELVRQGRDGFLFEPDSVTGLRAALEALQRADHATLSRNAREDAVTRFSKRAHLAALLGHYDEVTGVTVPAAVQLSPA